MDFLMWSWVGDHKSNLPVCVISYLRVTVADAFQSYQYDPDVCAHLQNITQHGEI